MKWAKSLILQAEETLETRVANILVYLSKQYQPMECVISDFEATGRYGSELTQELNDAKEKKVSITNLVSIVQEDAQIIEMNLFIESTDNFMIIVRDGSGVDILGDGEQLPSTVIGDNVDIDKSLYCF